MRWIFVAIAALWFMAACTDRRAAEFMPRAEAVLDSLPDSALVWMESIDGRRLRGGQRARHALLLTRARYKCYVPQTSDSLISIAADYYRGHAGSEPDRLVQALFHKAEILHESGQNTRALLTAMEAERTPGFGHDPEFAARVYNLMADIYGQSYMFDSELEYTRRAVDMYSRTKWRKNYLYTLIDEAIVLTALKDYDGSIALLDSVMPLCHAYGNQDVIGSCLSAYQRPLRATGQFGKMDSLCREMFVLVCAGLYRPQIDNYRQYSYVEIRNGNIKRADSLLTVADGVCVTELDTFAVKLARITLNNHLQNYRESNELYAEVLDFQDRKVASILKQSVAAAQRDYYKAEVELAEQERIATRHYMVYGMAIGVIIILALLLIMIERRRRYRQARDAYMESIDGVRHELEAVAEKSDAMTAVVRKLYAGHFSTFNSLCESYHQHHGASNYKVRLRIYDEIRDEFSKMSSPDSVKEIETIVNECRDGIIHRLREQMPELSDDDFRFMTFMCAGMSMKTIGLMMGIKVESVYSRKSRLKSKFHTSSAPDRELFIASLC